MQSQRRIERTHALAAGRAGVVGAAQRDPADHGLHLLGPIALADRLPTAGTGAARARLARSPRRQARRQQPRPDRQHPVAHRRFRRLQVQSLRGHLVPQPRQLRPQRRQHPAARAIVHPDALPRRPPAASRLRSVEAGRVSLHSDNSCAHTSLGSVRKTGHEQRAGRGCIVPGVRQT